MPCLADHFLGLVIFCMLHNNTYYYFIVAVITTSSCNVYLDLFRLLAKQKNKDSNDKKLSWWEDDQDSDFHLSEEDSDDSCNEESGMCNTMLVVGPRGAGKTAAVYACAKELGYKVG